MKNHAPRRIAAFLIAAITGLLSQLPVVCAAGTVTVNDLRCEYQTDPLGIATPQPRLGWILASDERGQQQTAYQVLVASTAGLLAENKGDLWDSGKVVSDESAHVAYAGSALPSRQRCWWKVRTWDRAGAASAWSAPATWTMGLLQALDWQAQWIGARAEVAGDPAVLGYAVEGKKPDDVNWVQVDLGGMSSIERVVLHPMLHNDPAAGGWIKGYAFPSRFRIDVSGEADFKTFTTLADHTQADYPNPGMVPVIFEAGGKTARFVRLTVSRLWQRGPGLPFVFTLGEMQVFSAGKNIALKAVVTASASVEGSGWSKAYLTDGLQVCPAAKTPASPDPYPHAAVLLRKEITIAKPVKRAIAYMCGLGWSELYVQGRKAGDAVLSPAFTDYTKRVEYVIQDVTGHMQPGPNAIGVILGNGFLSTPGKGYLKWYGNGGPPRLLLQLEIEFTDGTRQTVVSDASWKWSTGEITFNDLWQGERIDARLAKTGWDRAGYRDAGWQPVIQLDPPGGRLVPRAEPPIRVCESTKSVRIEGDKFFFDAVSAGWLKLKTTGKAGDVVRIYSIGNPIPGAVRPVVECTLKGGGEEVFEPRFLFHTIETEVTVEGLTAPATPDTLTRQAVHIDLSRAGGFACSNPFLNRMYESLLRTQRNYNYDHPQDPTREKSGWTQDVMTMIDTTVYDFDAATFYWKWWQDMRDNQQSNGYLGSVVPVIGRVINDCNDPWWSGMVVLTPWKLYEYYGDRRFLEEGYPGMTAYVDWLGSIAKDHIVSWGLGDWLEVGSPGGSPSPKRTAVVLTSTCGYYHYATILSRTATILGKTDDAAKYARLAETIKTCFNQQFFNTRTGQYGEVEDSQTARILPLSLGLVPGDQRQFVIDRLVSNIHGRKDHVSTGFIGNLFLLLGLPEMGQAELGYTVATQQDYPGWNTLVRRGVQLETWDGGQAQMPSLGGPIGTWMYQVLAGIRPDPAASGFKKILIKPQPVGDLTWVKAHHDCPYGRIVSHWNRESDKFTLEVTIPVNTRATVFVPAKDAASVTESGGPVNPAKGVEFLRLLDNAAVYAVGSGTYRFQSTLPESIKGR